MYIVIPQMLKSDDKCAAKIQLIRHLFCYLWKKM